ncbi:hypothetical protein STIAU_2328 [Stigmatella aurantiaca DW4/3-1]|uniref:Uncharacterized protein n=1 Tax=Stigmatella aurantiaca (strain DW4/3-1) TaxID=378806 RepID=Q08WI9_STIAD|nr:hypothetical protein STIAU_2328 [Stigmatella aurantiaca DW4/3-1]
MVRRPGSADGAVNSIVSGWVEFIKQGPERLVQAHRATRDGGDDGRLGRELPGEQERLLGVVPFDLVMKPQPLKRRGLHRPGDALEHAVHELDDLVGGDLSGHERGETLVRIGREVMLGQTPGEPPSRLQVPLAEPPGLQPFEPVEEAANQDPMRARQVAFAQLLRQLTGEQAANRLIGGQGGDVGEPAREVLRGPLVQVMNEQPERLAIHVPCDAAHEGVLVKGHSRRTADHLLGRGEAHGSRRGGGDASGGVDVTGLGGQVERYPGLRRIVPQRDPTLHSHARLQRTIGEALDEGVVRGGADGPALQVRGNPLTDRLVVPGIGAGRHIDRRHRARAVFAAESVAREGGPERHGRVASEHRAREAAGLARHVIGGGFAGRLEVGGGGPMVMDIHLDAGLIRQEVQREIFDLIEVRAPARRGLRQRGPRAMDAQASKRLFDKRWRQGPPVSLGIEVGLEEGALAASEDDGAPDRESTLDRPFEKQILHAAEHAGMDPELLNEPIVQLEARGPLRTQGGLIPLRLEQHPEFDLFTGDGHRELDRRVIVRDLRGPGRLVGQRLTAPGQEQAPERRDDFTALCVHLGRIT